MDLNEVLLEAAGEGNMLILETAIKKVRILMRRIMMGVLL